MASESTIVYTLKDWQQATKDWVFSTWPEKSSTLANTLFINNLAPESSLFTRSDFEEALKKTSRKRNLPIGEHIQEAIDIIKRKDE